MSYYYCAAEVLELEMEKMLFSTVLDTQRDGIGKRGRENAVNLVNGVGGSRGSTFLIIFQS